MTTDGRDAETGEDRVSAIGLLFEIARSIETRLAPRLAEHGVPWLDGGVLIRLSRAPEQRLRMSDLASQAALSNSGLTRIVDRLEESGLVQRESSATDRRVTYVALTDEGADRVAAFMPGQLDRIDQIFAGITPQETEELLSTLGKIRDSARAGTTPTASTGVTGSASAPAGR